MCVWGGEWGGGPLANQMRLEQRGKSCVSLTINLKRGIFEVVLASFYGVFAKTGLMVCNLSQTTSRNALKIHVGRGKGLGHGGVGMNG